VASRVLVPVDNFNCLCFSQRVDSLLNVVCGGPPFLLLSVGSRLRDDGRRMLGLQDLLELLVQGGRLLMAYLVFRHSAKVKHGPVD
jgi:hypothetical protein